MRIVVALFFALAALFAGPLSAQVLSVETYVEEWSPAQQKWVRIDEAANEAPAPASLRDPSATGTDTGTDTGAHRFAAAPLGTASSKSAIAQYGPFRVIDHDHAEMVGVTDRFSPAKFAAMLRDYPSLKTLKLVEAPGTDDDRANMKVGRMIRAAGITTHVPNGGSVRSGAVELFLAGANRQIDDGAEFAVHSWIDAHGRQPHDFAMDATPNRMYLDYYREMGMTRAEAVAFYAMTNSVEHADAKWLTARDMRGWLGQDNIAPSSAEPAEMALAVAAQTLIKEPAAPQIAYLDLNALLP